MPAKAVELGPQFIRDDAAWLNEANHAAQPLQEAGIIALDGPSVLAVKDFRWRPVGAPPNGAVHNGDLVPLTTAINEPGYTVGWRGKKGVEDELTTAYLEDGRPADLYLAPSRGLDAILQSHPELYRSTLEVDVGPFDTMREAYGALGRRVFSVMKLLPDGVMVDPASARMQDVPDEAAVAPNPYVLMKYREYKEDGILTFLGHGVHEHHDAHVQYLPVITKYLRPVAYLLNAGLSAAPFGFGELRPELSRHLQDEELAAFDGQQPHSVRYLARLLGRAQGGHLGGVGFGVVHSNIHDALDYADERMRDGDIDVPAREYGPYADVRPRWDSLPGQPGHLGRVELCVKDTAAHRIETLWAYGELSTGVIRQLEAAAAEGESGVARLHEDYPELFGTSSDDRVFADEQLSLAHANSLRHAYHGNDALIENGLGEREVPLRQQVGKLLEFAERDGRMLPTEAVRIISQSLMTTAEVEKVMEQYQTDGEAPSLSGYYETGAGSPAQWMIKHADVLTARGVAEPDVIRMGTQDRIRSFGSYITGLYASQN